MRALRIGVIGLVESVTAMGIQPQQERKIYSEPLRGQALKVDPEIMTSLMAVLKFRCGAVVNYNMILGRLGLCHAPHGAVRDESDSGNGGRGPQQGP